MKTIIYKEIDGFKIVAGIGEAGGLIDPEATKTVVNKEILKTQVWKNISDIKKQMQVYANQAMQAKKGWKNAKSDAEKRKLTDEWNLRTGQMKELEKDLLPLAQELKQKHSELVIEKAVYFENGTDKIVSDEVAQEISDLIIQATNEGKLVDENKNLIVNNKGKVFYKEDGSDWIKTEINKIGVNSPTGSIEDKNLTPEQRLEIAEYFEIKRVSELSASAKADEKEAKIEALAGQAGLMKSSLEIQGVSDALEQAQAWYDSEVAKLDLIYG